MIFTTVNSNIPDFEKMIKEVLADMDSMVEILSSDRNGKKEEKHSADREEKKDSVNNLHLAKEVWKSNKPQDKTQEKPETKQDDKKPVDDNSDTVKAFGADAVTTGRIYPDGTTEIKIVFNRPKDTFEDKVLADIHNALQELNGTGLLCALKQIEVLCKEKFLRKYNKPD